jgi:hypothetical protein
LPLRRKRPRLRFGRASVQEAPLTPEYQAIFDAGQADQAAGGQGTNPTATGLAPGMPRSINVYHPMEIVITPDTVHILDQHDAGEYNWSGFSCSRRLDWTRLR